MHYLLSSVRVQGLIGVHRVAFVTVSLGETLKINPILVAAAAAVATLAWAGAASAIPGDTLWTKAYGGSGDDRASTVIPATDGGYLLAGGTQSFGFGSPGFYDMWLVKVNAQGDSLWSHTYGGSGDEYATSIVPCGDGYLLAGYTTSFGAGGYDMWLVRVNAQGDSLWSSTYGGPGFDEAYTVIPSDSGNYLLAGWTNSFGAGAFDVWLVKVDSSGNMISQHTYGGSNDDFANCIIPTDDGGFLLAGLTKSWGAVVEDGLLLKINAQLDSLWAHAYDYRLYEKFFSIIPTDDDGYLLTGGTHIANSNEDIWLVKVDEVGDTLWSHAYGGVGVEEAYTLIPNGQGDFLLAGYTGSFGAGQYDMFLLRVNALGDSVGFCTYGGPLFEEAHSLLPTSDGKFLLAGTTSSFGPPSYNMWLVKAEDPANPVRLQGPAQPCEFAFPPVRPNPFNASTVTSYKLQVASYVSLKVYNTAGKLVTTLVDGWMNAGEHQTTFDGSKLASGVYLARLEAGEFTQVQKVVLLK
jgi:hypothetical protein